MEDIVFDDLAKTPDDNPPPKLVLTRRLHNYEYDDMLL